MIRPSIGRVVWLRRPGNASGQPEAALITFVHSDSMINVGGFDANGSPIAASSVLLVQGDMPLPPGVGYTYAEWMPYQKGQAAKEAMPINPPEAVLFTTRRYPCGCSAGGVGDVPAYCSEHGTPP